jgi:predicted MFS family arabinose efflux permease
MDSIVFPTLPTYLFEPSLAGALSLILTIILPLLAALLMKSRWSAFQKGVVLLLLATAKAFVEAWIGAVDSGEHFDLWRVLYADVINFGIAVGAYVGLLKGTAVQRSAIESGVKDRP